MENISKYYPATGISCFWILQFLDLDHNVWFSQHNLGINNSWESEIQVAIMLIKKGGSREHGLRGKDCSLNPSLCSSPSMKVTFLTFPLLVPFSHLYYCLVLASIGLHLGLHNNLLTGPSVSSLTLSRLSSLLMVYKNTIIWGPGSKSFNGSPLARGQSSNFVAMVPDASGSAFPCYSVADTPSCLPNSIFSFFYISITTNFQLSTLATITESIRSL